jgi:putative aldouronate transport system substrate-binding protein
MTGSRRRAVGGFAACALILGLAACGAEDEGKGDGADSAELGRVGAMEDYGVGDTFVATEPVEFSMLYRDHPNYPLDEDWLFFQTVESRNNVTFDITTAPLSDWEERRSLLVSAGDAPSFIPVTYTPDEQAFVASGAIIPVSDYLDLMPNFTAKVEEWGLEPELDTLRQEDGKFYVLPGLLEDLRPDNTLAMRMDVLDELGLDEPTSWDEVADVLQAMKDAYPDMPYVWSERWKGDSLLQYAAPAFGTVGGWAYGSGAVWTGDEFVYAGATDEYKEMVEYFAGLVADGLMDPESFTQEDDAATQKLVNEQSFVISTNAQELIGNRTAMAEALGEGNFELAKIRVPSGPAGDIISGIRMESGLMISANALKQDNFVAMMQFIDWLYYSDEGLEFARWGVEGKTFDRAADGTRTLAADVNFGGQNPEGTTDLQVDYGFFNGVFMLAHGSTADLTLTHLTEEEVEWRGTMADKERTEVPPPYPFNELEREEASLYQTALTDYVKQNTLAFITGQRDLSEWDAYVSELEGLNMGAFLDLVNGAQQRYADANG